MASAPCRLADKPIGCPSALALARARDGVALVQETPTGSLSIQNKCEKWLITNKRVSFPPGPWWRRFRTFQKLCLCWRAWPFTGKDFVGVTIGQLTWTLTRVWFVWKHDTCILSDGSQDANSRGTPFLQKADYITISCDGFRFFFLPVTYIFSFKTRALKLPWPPRRGAFSFSNVDEVTWKMASLLC